MENYCYLFVLILQQYYSLLYYSKKIALISDGKSKLKKASYIKMLELTDELNEFFLRNTFPQVSHISHQNEVYEYIRNIYKINDFYEQVNNGLQAVAEKAKSYRSEKHDDLIKIFSIIGAFWGISEVICNTSDIIVFVLGKKQADTEWLMILIYVLLLTALSGFLVWLIWYISKRKK